MSFNKRILSAGAAPFVNSKNFKAVTYTGNSASDNSGTTQSITGVGFQPDWVVIKRRDGAENHYVQDSTRGSTKQLYWNSADPEFNQTNAVTSFDSDGFTVSGYNGTNNNGETYVAWCWRANGGTTSTDTNGSINSTVQTNANASFSIVGWTGNGTAGATIGHNLGAVPDMFIVKKRGSGNTNWRTYHKDSHPTAPEDYNLEINGLTPAEDRTEWNDTAPTSTVFSVSSHDSVNENGTGYVAYAFKSIAGFSKFDKYEGNSSNNGPIVETGFEPAFLMIKNTDDNGSWFIYDNKRNTSNPRINYLLANGTNQEASDLNGVNFLSNGFQILEDHDDVNDTGDTYIYMAFAADPDEEAPTLASSFNIETYTGNGSTQTISGLGFNPSFVWIKPRSFVDNHVLSNIVSGVNKSLAANTNSAEQTTLGVSSFDSDGFSLPQWGNVTDSGEDFVAWTWKADDNEPTYNTNGSINSIVSANANAGFSIVEWTGTGSNGTVGHGLSSAPELIISKNVDTAATDGWPVYHSAIGNDHTFFLNSTAAKTSTGGTWGSTSPTSTVFTVQDNDSNNQSANKIIAYCFHSVTGYQKIGSFTGDGNNDRAVTTGFKPDFVLIKSTVGSDNWRLYDTRRGVDEGGYLEPNRSDADDTSNAPNLLMTSTGFTITSGGVTAGNNVNGNLYTYWAVAKNVPSNTTLANSFKTLTWTGNGGTQSITGAGFRPDLVWIKERSSTGFHNLFDTVRGATNRIFSNSTGGGESIITSLSSFDSDGFSLGSEGDVNANSDTYVAWCWKAGNTWQSNIDGTQPSLVNANTANGFSIVKWKTNGSSSQTVGHGLSSTPQIVMYKRLGASQDWFVETNVIDGSYDYGNLNTNAAFTTNETGAWSTRATSTTITNFTSSDNFEYIAYCWHDVTGYSKFGTYSGTGSAQTITTGFAPDFVITKRTNSTDNWRMYDSVRQNAQPFDEVLYPNDNAGEDDNTTGITGTTATGFTLGTGNLSNNNGDTYIYMAFKAN